MNAEMEIHKFIVVNTKRSTAGMLHRKSIFVDMKNIYLLIAGLLFALPTFSQTQTTPEHGKTTTPHKGIIAPVDPKQAEMAKSIESKMVMIDGGTFTMGCVLAGDSECYAWEKPRHTVTLNTFYMGKYDVTQKEWKALMGTTPDKKYCAECPVVYVTWFDAQLFINKLNQISGKNYRLPTEAEWEYAAKGGNKSHGYKYAGGNESKTVAWWDSTVSLYVHPAGEKKANELGLFDMSGNVWQWCADWFNEKYYSTGPSNNPPGPEKEKGNGSRVVRGGSWWGPERDCRVANRDMYPPDSKDDDVGFRIVRN
jgi:formylglycine-generating enzyme required for sulfatase activity